MSSQPTLIEIKDLKKSFGDNLVLKGIDLNIKEKEVVCIIGPSGSGKSTLLRCVNYLEIPSEGEVKIQNEIIGKNCSEKKLDLQRAQLGMVFQNFNLFGHLTVLENLTLAPINVKQLNKKDATETALHY